MPEEISFSKITQFYNMEIYQHPHLCRPMLPLGLIVDEYRGRTMKPAGLIFHQHRFRPQYLWIDILPALVPIHGTPMIDCPLAFVPTHETFDIEGPPALVLTHGTLRIDYPIALVPTKVSMGLTVHKYRCQPMESLGLIVHQHRYQHMVTTRTNHDSLPATMTTIISRTIIDQHLRC